MGSIPQLSILKGPVKNVTPNPINCLFENVANGNASKKVALIFEENDKLRQHTYSEVDKITNQLARTIKQTIINNPPLERNSDGDYIVAVNMHPSDHLIMVLLAIWKAGAAYLPLDHAFPGTRIQHILKEAKPALVIYDDENRNLNSDYVNKPHIISLDQLRNSSKNQSKDNIVDEERFHHVRDDLAIVLYTSGSTGVPKGVRLPHSVVLNRLQWQFHRFPYSETEKVCVFKTALTFVDSISEIWGPLINGLSVLVISKALTKDPEKLISRLDDYKIERLVLVPSLLRSLLMYLDFKKTTTTLENLKIWVCSGETLTVSLAEEFFRHFPSNKHILCNFYGSTEIMGDVTYHIIDDSQLSQLDKVPIGIPIDNTIIYLLDNDFRPVKIGQVGELYVAGLNLAAGYVNGRDPEKFIDNPLAIDSNYTKLYRTGDFASVVKNTLLYEGRTDSQVKIRGHRVDLAEVEKAVNSIDGIDKAVVLCYRPGEIDQVLLAFATTKNQLINEYQIEAKLKEKLTSYMIPQVVIVESIPLLVNGKVDRQGLLKMYENTNNNDDACVQYDIDYSGIPKVDLQIAKDLFECIALVLGRTARSVISTTCNYYEIGGNSLNSIVIVTQMNEKGYNLSIADFISSANLGEVLNNMKMKRNQSTITNQFSKLYTSEPLQRHHRNIVLDMVTTSFYHKADLEQWIISDISEVDYLELIEALWEPLLEKNLSFVAKNERNDIIGVALNFDARDEPEVEIKSKLTVIFEFLESIEGPIRDLQLPQGKGKILHSFMMATHSTLKPKENIAVMEFMESEVLKLAKEKKFAGIFTTNTSPLTQQLGCNVYNYKTMLDFQVNKYIASDGTKPFKEAPDSQRAIVHWKSIST